MTEQERIPPGRDVTIGAGGLPPEEDVPDGTHAIMLTELGEWRWVEGKPGSPYYKPGEGKWYRDWFFHVTDGPYAGRRVTGSASDSSGPRSKQFGFIHALNGGKEPQAGERFDVDSLVGRVAYGKVVHDDGGYPKVDELMAMPAAQLQQQLATATGAPTTPQAQVPGSGAPLREAVAGKPDDQLPF